MNKPQQIDWKQKQYNSKYENYDISQRLADLRNIVEIQCSRGNYDVDHYMRGMANGLLLAWTIMAEPYGASTPFFHPEVVPKESTEA